MHDSNGLSDMAQVLLGIAAFQIGGLTHEERLSKVSNSLLFGHVTAISRWVLHEEAV